MDRQLNEKKVMGNPKKPLTLPKSSNKVNPMKKQKWIDSKGTTVYETGKRCSKSKTLLTLGEITSMEHCLSGTVGKYEAVFFLPFKKVVDFL
jgi:hypothetical protein